MTEKELKAKIADTMKSLKSDDVKKVCKKAYSDYEHEIKNEICKKLGVKEWSDIPAGERSGLLEKESEMYPIESHLYVMFDDEGDLQGWTVDHQQYFQGHSGPTSAIFIGADGVDYEDVRREIGNDLFEAIEVE